MTARQSGYVGRGAHSSGRSSRLKKQPIVLAQPDIDATVTLPFPLIRSPVACAYRHLRTFSRGAFNGLYLSDDQVLEPRRYTQKLALRERFDALFQFQRYTCLHKL